MLNREGVSGVLFPDGPVAVSVVYWWPMPTSWSKKKKAAAERYEHRPTTKPDADNILKMVLDASNGILFSDDAQVVQMDCAAFYSENPGLTAMVRRPLIGNGGTDGR